MSNLRNDTSIYKFLKISNSRNGPSLLSYGFLEEFNLQNGQTQVWISENIQFTKWMESFFMDSWNCSISINCSKILNLRNWPKHRYTFLKISNSRNGPSPYLVMDSWNSSIYEMDQSYIVIFRKCTIFEMAKIQIWISKNIQFTKWPKSLYVVMDSWNSTIQSWTRVVLQVC